VPLGIVVVCDDVPEDPAFVAALCTATMVPGVGVVPAALALRATPTVSQADDEIIPHDVEYAPAVAAVRIVTGLKETVPPNGPA
jgi:hypothetical protein